MNEYSGLLLIGQIIFYASLLDTVAPVALSSTQLQFLVLAVAEAGKAVHDPKRVFPLLKLHTTKVGVRPRAGLCEQLWDWGTSWTFV
jgi:hypothetical protein